MECALRGLGLVEAPDLRQRSAASLFGWVQALPGIEKPVYVQESGELRL